jgi:tRNA 2-thiouridine synthesizing protein E
MNHQTALRRETETSASDIDERLAELANQHWDRSKSLALAEAEGIAFSDDHWNVIVYMRKYYLENGLPINARTTARAMNRQFSNQGGSRYLRQLFSEGPVAQGSRLASLRTPAYATDNSFGTTY